MRTILLAALFVLAAGAARAGDLNAILTSLAQDGRARTAVQTADAESLQATLDWLLSELQAGGAPAPAARPTAVLTAALSGPPRGPGASPPRRP